MHMRFRLFGKGAENERAVRNRPRYASGFQRDIQNYEGWTREQVEADYRASKKVHTIITLGYMEYEDDTLVLTDRGGMLMRNVVADASTTDRTSVQRS